MMSYSRQAIDIGLRQLLPGVVGYPAVLRRCSDDERSLSATTKGDLNLLDRTLVGFFCSVRCPGDIILKIYDLARTLRTVEVTFIGGFQSSMEKEFLGLLLRGSASVVVCPARGLDNMRIPRGWRGLVAEGRLLVLSFFNGKIHRATAATAAKRNAHVAALADRVLIAHAEKGGKTEKLCKDTLTQGKRVFVLDSSDNAHLIELGAVAVRADDPASLIA